MQGGSPDVMEIKGFKGTTEDRYLQYIWAFLSSLY